MGSFPIGTLFAILAMKDELSGPFTALARTVTSKSGEIGTQVEGVAVKIGNVNKVLRDFSGLPLMQKAEEMAAAVARLGGAAKLTEQEQQKVNAVVTEAIRKYQALGQEAPQHLKDLAVATTQVVKPTQDVAKQLSGWAAVQQRVHTEAGSFIGRVKDMALGVFTGAAAFSALQTAGRLAIQFLKDSITQALDADRIQRKLTSALEAQGTAIPEVARHYDALIRKYQDLTVHSGGALKDTQALLVQVGGVLPSEMDKALNAVTNLSAGLGTDLTSAANMVARSFEDNFGALKKAGVQIDETRAKAEGMTYVLGQIEAKFGGQARAEMQSYEGQLLNLKKAWSDFQEAVGKSALDLGLFQLAIIGLRLWIVRLNVELEFTLGMLRTMPSLSDILTRGFGAAAEWGQRAAAEIKRMREEAAKAKGAVEDLMKPVASHGGSAMAQAEARIRAYRLEQERLAAAARAAAKAEEEAARAAQQHAEEVRGIADAWSRQSVEKDIRKMSDAMVDFKRRGLTPTKEAIAEQVTQIDEWVAAGYTVPAMLAARRLAHLDLVAAMIPVTTTTDEIIRSTPNYIHLMKQAGAEEIARSKALDAMASAMAKLVNQLKTGDLLRIGAISGKALETALKAPAKTYAQVFSASLSEALRDLPTVILGAIQGGGDVGKAIGTFLGGSLTKGIGESVAKSIGGTLGKVVGSAIPVIGALLGGLAGAGLDSLIGKLTSREGRATNDARDTWMAEMGGLREVQKTIGEFANDPRLMNAFNRLYSTGKVKELERATADYQKRLKELNDQVQRNLASDGLWDQFTQNVLASGREIEGHTEALQRQADKLSSGLQRAMGGFAQSVAPAISRVKELDEELSAIHEKRGRESLDPFSAEDRARIGQIIAEMATLRASAVGSQDEFDRLSRIALAAFNTIVAQGRSPIDAVREIGGSLDVLADAFTTLGLEGSEAFGQLGRLRELARDNEPLLDSVAGLNDITVALANLGALNAETFADIQAQGVGAYQNIFNAAVNAGFTQAEAQRVALEQMGPYLSTIVQLHAAGKISIDEETQALINQAREQGVLAEVAKTEHQQLIDTLRLGLGGIIQVLGGELPAAWAGMADDAISEAERAARGAQAAFNGISVPTVTPGLAPAAGVPGPGFAGGTGGRYLDFGAGTPVVLHGRERVMTEAEGRAEASARPVYTGDAVFLLGADEVGRMSLERVLKALEQNDGGGAPVSPVMRARKALRVS